MELAKIGILPAKEKQFNKKGIHTVEDLIRFFPRNYNDFSRETGILPETEYSCIVVKLNFIKSIDGKMPILMAFCSYGPDNKKIKVTWFHQPYMENKIRPYIGKNIYVSGKITYDTSYKTYSITSPLVFTPDIINGKKIYSVYSKISGMSDEYLESKLVEAMKQEELFKETIPERIVSSNHLLSSAEALHELHFPTSIELLTKAQQRMVFDDLLYFALRIEKSQRAVSNGSQYNIKTLKIMNQVINSLPYTLTPDQKSSVDDMINNMRIGKRINALVQGDVGCGKSIVAFLMMIAMVDNNYQAVIMAPTQVLARQHYDDLVKLVSPYDINVAFFGSGMKKSEKNAILGDLENGNIGIVVGTHAVLNKSIKFKNLALVIADEEHKFGVVQRQSLIEKAASGVHSITMSATPIPRSLAQVVYGTSLSLYTIKTMPNGRKPVKTAITDNQKAVYRFLYRELNEGRQAYVVCPMIDKNEDMEGVKSVEEIAETYKKEFADKCGFKVATLNGRFTKEETETIINDFKAGKINILISTTVIEVGVNVPNASSIIIHNAERFGLSGLHQLRGRVGRGSYQSYCVLFSQEHDNERLKAMVETCNGFEIAEKDLQLRGAGELIGTKQSGDDKYMSLMLAYPKCYNVVKTVASKMLDIDEDCYIMDKVNRDDSNDENDLDD